MAQVLPDINDAPKAHYRLDPDRTTVVGRVSHLGVSHTTLRFTEVSGSLNLKEAAAPLNITIVVASVATGSKTLDANLRGDGWFAARAHPNMTFVATKLDLTGGRQGTVRGNLTLRGVTKPVEFKVNYNGYTETGQRLGFSATGSIRRRDFGMTAFSGPVSDKVDLTIEAEFVKKDLP